jgi:hypothetical protein
MNDEGDIRTAIRAYMLSRGKRRRSPRKTDKKPEEETKQDEAATLDQDTRAVVTLAAEQAALPPANYICRKRSQNDSECYCNHNDPKADDGRAENALSNFLNHTAPLDRQNESIGCSPQRNSVVKLKRQR